MAVAGAVGPCLPLKKQTKHTVDEQNNICDQTKQLKKLFKRHSRTLQYKVRPVP
jgi:hypothetical protein